MESAAAATNKKTEWEEGWFELDRINDSSLARLWVTGYNCFHSHPLLVVRAWHKDLNHMQSTLSILSNVI
jgi:hypothetical protein